MREDYRELEKIYTSNNVTFPLRVLDLFESDRVEHERKYLGWRS